MKVPPKFESHPNCGVRQNIDENDVGEHQNIFWLGNEPDSDIHTHGLCASPPFESLDDLDAFCFRHLAQYDSIASEIEKTNTYPDTWFWSEHSERVYLSATKAKQRQISQQEFLHQAMVHLDMTAKEFAARIGATTRRLDNWLTPRTGRVSRIGQRG